MTSNLLDDGDKLDILRRYVKDERCDSVCPSSVIARPRPLPLIDTLI
jgi:hypothetical protein